MVSLRRLLLPSASPSLLFPLLRLPPPSPSLPLPSPCCGRGTPNRPLLPCQEKQTGAEEMKRRRQQRDRREPRSSGNTNSGSQKERAGVGGEGEKIFGTKFEWCRTLSRKFGNPGSNHPPATSFGGSFYLTRTQDWGIGNQDELLIGMEPIRHPGPNNCVFCFPPMSKGLDIILF